MIFIAGGSLISDEFGVAVVITAAHCVSVPNVIYIQVILGAHNLNIDEPDRIAVNATITVIHPDYIPGDYSSTDAAMLFFDGYVVSPGKIETIDLAAQPSLYLLTAITASGFGVDDSGQSSTTLRAVTSIQLTAICFSQKLCMTNNGNRGNGICL